MSRSTYLFFLILFFYVSCGNNNGTSRADKKPQNPDDSSCYVSTIRNFLQWYEAKHNAIDSIQIIEKTKDSGWYKVDSKGVEKYLSYLRSSDYFTEKFLSDKYNYFQHINDNLAVIKQNDGPPEGLDADLLLFTQEPEEVLQRSQTLEIDVSKGSKEARLISSGNNLLFKMASAPGKCQIEGIQFEEKPAK